MVWFYQSLPPAFAVISRAVPAQPCLVLHWLFDDPIPTVLSKNNKGNKTQPRWSASLVQSDFQRLRLFASTLKPFRSVFSTTSLFTGSDSTQSRALYHLRELMKCLAHAPGDALEDGQGEEQDGELARTTRAWMMTRKKNRMVRISTCIVRGRSARISSNSRHPRSLNDITRFVSWPIHGPDRWRIANDVRYRCPLLRKLLMQSAFRPSRSISTSQVQQERRPQPVGTAATEAAPTRRQPGSKTG